MQQLSPAQDRNDVQSSLTIFSVNIGFNPDDLYIPELPKN